MTPAPSRRPNILLILADQLGAHALDRDAELVSTPHLDRLAASGADFSRAYVSFPLCVPSRASMLTGRMPHELGIQGNAAAATESQTEPGLRADSLGHLLSDAGYDCAYAGKWHATSPSAPVGAGFEVLAPFGDARLAEDCASWLRSRSDDSAPFFLCASFDDPHTICEYARRQPMPYGDTADVAPRDAPPLPANFDPASFEPEAVRHEKHAANSMYGTADFTPDEWRAYRHAYRQLIERVDGYVGTLRGALDEAGLADNTMIVFTSDHGDGDASHRWNQKTALFEECVRVPLIVSGPGTMPSRVPDPVAVCLDLLPTVCTWADVDTPQSRGRPLNLTGSAPTPDRDVVVETRFDRPGPPLTRGRALYAGPYKYVVYSWGRYREQLHNIDDDPGEMRNLAVESRFDDVLDDMRLRLLHSCRETDDADALKYLIVPHSADPRIREEIFTVPY